MGLRDESTGRTESGGPGETDRPEGVEDSGPEVP